MPTVPIAAEMDRQDLINSLAQMDGEDVIGFVIDLDLARADYEFTENLIQKLQDSLRDDDETDLKGEG